MNRKPNIMYIHRGLAKGVCENGFDPNRPRPGCVIRFQSPEGLAKLKKDALRDAVPPFGRARA